MVEATTTGEAVPSLTRGRRHPLLRVARLGFLAAVIVLPVLAVADRWHDVSHGVVLIGPVRTVLCLPLVVLGLWAGMRSWRVILGVLGSPLDTHEAARVYFVGQLGKYIPGSLWPVVAQMELGRDHAVPRRRSAAALIIAIMVSIASGVSVAAATMPFVAGARHHWLWWLVPAAPLMLIVLHPRVLWGVLGRVPVARLRPALPPPPAASAQARAVAWSVMGWFAYGVHVAVLGSAFASAEGALLVASIGGYALAWVAGLVAFALPAGAGARDVALVVALSTSLRTGQAIALAVISRAVTTACDLALAGGRGDGVAPGGG